MFSVCRERLIFDQKIVLYVFWTKIGYGETSRILLTRQTFSWPEYHNAIIRITCLLTDKSYTFSGNKLDVRRIQFLSGKHIRRFLVKNWTFFYRAGYFFPYFFYIFTFTNLLWILWTLWTYRDLLVKRLQRLKSDNKSIHSTVHGSSQLWTGHSSTPYSFCLSRVQ